MISLRMPVNTLAVNAINNLFKATILVNKSLDLYSVINYVSYVMPARQKILRIVSTVDAQSNK